MWLRSDRVFVLRPNVRRRRRNRYDRHETYVTPRHRYARLVTRRPRVYKTYTFGGGGGSSCSSTVRVSGGRPRSSSSPTMGGCADDGCPPPARGAKPAEEGDRCTRGSVRVISHPTPPFPPHSDKNLQSAHVRGLKKNNKTQRAPHVIHIQVLLLRMQRFCFFHLFNFYSINIVVRLGLGLANVLCFYISVLKTIDYNWLLLVNLNILRVFFLIILYTILLFKCNLPMILVETSYIIFVVLVKLKRKKPFLNLWHYLCCKTTFLSAINTICMLFFNIYLYIFLFVYKNSAKYNYQQWKIIC